MRRHAWLVWMAALPLLPAALAGCAAGGAGDDGGVRLGDGSTVDLTGNPTAETGAIAGVVVDEAIRPIATANVSLPSEGLEMDVDEGGVFILDGLEPGLYILSVAAPGFERVQTTAEVAAGQTAQVRVLLPRDDSPVPYTVTYAKDGFIQAWAGIAQYYVENQLPEGSAACDCRLFFTPEPDTQTLVYEAYWEDALADPGGLAEFYWVVEQLEGDGYDAGYCFSPCIEHVSFEGYSPVTETYARLDGPDLWPAFQQRFQLFVTVWAKAEAPDGWSIATAG